MSIVFSADAIRKNLGKEKAKQILLVANIRVSAKKRV
jgi:hypothetical protein